MKICIKCGIEKDEREFKENLNRCNLCISEYQKLYRDSHKEKSKEYLKNYYNENREDLLLKAKEYYIENIKYVTDYKHDYYISNKENIKEYNKDYYVENKDVLDKINKIYREENKDRVNKRRNERNKEIREYLNEKQRNRRKSNSTYRISQNIRVYLRYTLKSRGFKKKTKTQDILGCSFEEFKIHMESKFEIWMTWDNYGIYDGELNHGWDIDHIVPLSSAKTEEEVIRLNHFSNLQPLCSYVNRYIKGDKLI